MEHIFRQIEHIFGDAEIAGILIIVLILSLIAVNVITCVCIISMRNSLKRIAGPKEHKHKKLLTDEKLDKKSSNVNQTNANIL